MSENLPSTMNSEPIVVKDAQTSQFELAQRQAKLLATSTIIPDHYKGNMGNCYIAVHAASTLGIDPLMLMQRSYVVHGKLAVEGQLVIALVNKRGQYAKPLDWRFDGKEGTDAYSCTCIGYKEDGTFDSVKLTIKEVKAMGWWKNSIWQNLTDQMLCYRTATFLARRYCPEVLMGFATDDELPKVGASMSVEKGPSAALNEALRLNPEPEEEAIEIDVEVEVEEMKI